MFKLKDTVSEQDLIDAGFKKNKYGLFTMPIKVTDNTTIVFTLIVDRGIIVAYYSNLVSTYTECDPSEEMRDELLNKMFKEIKIERIDE